MAAKAAAKKGAAKKSSTNGGSPRADLLEDYTEAQRRKLATAIIRMKKSGAKWGEIGEELELPGEKPSVVGRRLLREYSDSGEDYIRERAAAGTGSKTKAKAKTATKRRAKAVEEDEDDEPAPRARRKKVTVKRGRGKAGNP